MISTYIRKCYKFFDKETANNEEEFIRKYQIDLGEKISIDSPINILFLRDQGWIPFENTEENYLMALGTAFNELVMDFNNDITTDYVLTLHQYATQDVKI